MKKIIFCITAGVFVIATGCGTNSATKSDDVLTDTASIDISKLPPAPEKPLEASGVQPVGVQTTTGPANITIPATTVPATTTTGATGLNPKHGQPGHRCDIPEGAPLNSKPTTSTTTSPVTTTVTPPVITPQPATTTTVKTAPGMNPPHGQPGHVCGIPVGSPLNSKPSPQKLEPVVLHPQDQAPPAASPNGNLNKKDSTIKHP